MAGSLAQLQSFLRAQAPPGALPAAAPSAYAPAPFCAVPPPHLWLPGAGAFLMQTRPASSQTPRYLACGGVVAPWMPGHPVAHGHRGEIAQWQQLPLSHTDRSQHQLQNHLPLRRALHQPASWHVPDPQVMAPTEVHSGEGKAATIGPERVQGPQRFGNSGTASVMTLQELRQGGALPLAPSGTLGLHLLASAATRVNGNGQLLLPRSDVLLGSKEPAGEGVGRGCCWRRPAWRQQHCAAIASSHKRTESSSEHEGPAGHRKRVVRAGY
jgi:hypothetical protein